jgi:hypothetical protein
MDWLQFSAAIVGHVAWPAVIIVLFVILRKHMGTLADRLLEFSFGGAKITFDKILEKNAEIIEQASPQPTVQSDEPELKKVRPGYTINLSRPKGSTRKRWHNSPLSLVISGLEAVDNLLFEIGDKIGVDAATPLSVMYTLVASKLVGQQISDFYENLRDARNLISHAQTVPDEREALEYVRQADFLLASLSVLKGKIESGEITLQNKAP